MEHSCHQHPSHIEEISRINRVIGQMEGVKKMIEERRYCPDIMIQLKAIQFASKSIESNILKKHIYECVQQSFAKQDEAKVREKIDELVLLFKK